MSYFKQNFPDELGMKHGDGSFLESRIVYSVAVTLSLSVK